MALVLSETKKGMAETQSDIREIRDSINDVFSDELDAVWQKIKDMAISLCPIESGALASSIELENEGGSGKIGISGSGEFYHNAIYAGNDSTFNFDGQSTSQYAQSVHDGHMLPDGTFWEGTPFLEDAVDFYEDELNAIIDKALSQLNIGDSNVPSTDKLGESSD